MGNTVFGAGRPLTARRALPWWSVKTDISRKETETEKKVAGPEQSGMITPRTGVVSACRVGARPVASE
jgi:hypothetical protein